MTSRALLLLAVAASTAAASPIIPLTNEPAVLGFGSCIFSNSVVWGGSVCTGDVEAEHSVLHAASDGVCLAATGGISYHDRSVSGQEVDAGVTVHVDSTSYVRKPVNGSSGPAADAKALFSSISTAIHGLTTKYTSTPCSGSGSSVTCNLADPTVNVATVPASVNISNVYLQINAAANSTNLIIFPHDGDVEAGGAWGNDDSAELFFAFPNAHSLTIRRTTARGSIFAGGAKVLLDHVYTTEGIYSGGPLHLVHTVIRKRL